MTLPRSSMFRRSVSATKSTKEFASSASISRRQTLNSPLKKGTGLLRTLRNAGNLQGNKSPVPFFNGLLSMHLGPGADHITRLGQDGGKAIAGFLCLF